MSAGSSAFVSYSREDSEFALRLTRDLKAAGAHVWLDQLDIVPGHPWDNAIEEALNDAPQMLLILSPASAKSENVRNEISYALEAGKIIIPVLYMDCIVPLRLQRTQRIDFRADYVRGLSSLLTHLHVAEPDLTVLEKAAEEETKRHTAWQAREAEAQRLRESPERQAEEDERKAREEEQLRLKQAREQQQHERDAAILREKQREIEAATLRDKQRQAEAATAALRAEAAAAAAVLAEKQRKAREETDARRKLFIRQALIGGAAIGLVVLVVFGIVRLFRPMPPSTDQTNIPSAQTVPPPASAVQLYDKATGPDYRNDMKGAIPLLQQSCTQGYAEGCMTLGYRYEEGMGIAANQFQAVAFYQKSCNAGNATGCDHLGDHYLSGVGFFTGQNLALAKQTYQKSCSMGSQAACFSLKDDKLQSVPTITSTLTTTNPSTTSPATIPASAETAFQQADADFDRKDFQDAAPLYQQACDFGEMRGCLTLGYQYSNGEGVTKNPQKAVSLYQKACDGGQAEACRNLGNHLRDGDGAAQNPTLAVFDFQKACTSGDAVGCRNLAILYETGTQIPQNLATAKQYYQKGCTGKDQPSCDALKNAKFNN